MATRKKVTNVSNTGVRETSTQSTGSTGAVSNTVNKTTTGTRPVSYSALPHTDVNAAIADARTRVAEATSGLRTARGDAVDGAFAAADGALARARAQALSAVPAEYRDQVNAHFDTAATHVTDMRKKFKGA